MGGNGFTLVNGEQLQGSYSGNHNVLGDFKQNGDAGTWSVTNKRLHFKFLGITSLENNIYFEDVISITKGIQPMFYEFKVERGSRSVSIDDVVYVGIAPWQAKKAIQYIVEQVGEDKYQEKKGFSTYFLYCLLGLSAFILLFVIFGSIFLR